MILDAGIMLAVLRRVKQHRSEVDPWLLVAVFVITTPPIRLALDIRPGVLRAGDRLLAIGAARVPLAQGRPLWLNSTGEIVGFAR
jgi:hypothetical protein